MEKSITEKLDLIPTSEYAKRDREIIDSWKERVPKLIAQADFLKHPIVEDLKKETQSHIDAINNLLSGDPNLSTEQRHRLFGEKDAHKLLLSFLTRDPQGELETINKSVSMEIE